MWRINDAGTEVRTKPHTLFDNEVNKAIPCPG